MQPLESSSSQPLPSGAPGSDFRSDPRWKLVERILLTTPFQKSVNLSALFSYLATNSILGKADALTERQIGIGVFGKPADYSPAEDSAVRVHVRQLRLRLHEYFAKEGRNEIQRVEIPKGSYVLEFGSSQSQLQPRPGVEPAWTTKDGVWKIPWQKALFWIAIVAALVCGFGWYHAAKTAAAPATVPWPLNAVIQPGLPVKVVVSDGNLSTLRFLAPSEITLEQYLRPDFRTSLISPQLDPHLARVMSYVSRSELTSFADAAVVSALVKLAGASSDQLVLTSARDLDRRDLEKGNYVFVGSPVSNPWVSLFEDQLNFQVVEEGVGGKMYFRNLKPLPGEQSAYEGLTQTGSTGEDYATLSLLPSGMGQGNILILQGLRQEGTEALGAMLADAAYRAQLAHALGVRANSNASPYFEALIRARTVAGAPVSIEIVAVRSIAH